MGGFIQMFWGIFLHKKKKKVSIYFSCLGERCNTEAPEMFCILPNFPWTFHQHGDEQIVTLNLNKSFGVNYETKKENPQISL